MENKVEKKEIINEVDVTPGFSSLQGFQLVQRQAQLLASSKLIPDVYKGNVPDCAVVINMAQRMGADPMMVMQNLYVVHGKPAWSSQFLISAFNINGRFSSLRYEWFGKLGEDDFGCRAWAIEKETGERLEGSVITIKMAKDEKWYDKTGSKWKTMPQQMLMYRAAAFFIRAYAPELAMGMHTREEMEDIQTVDVEVIEDNVQEKAKKEIKENANKVEDVIDVVTGEIIKEEAKKAEADVPMPDVNDQEELF